MTCRCPDIITHMLCECCLREANFEIKESGQMQRQQGLRTWKLNPNTNHFGSIPFLVRPTNHRLRAPVSDKALSRIHYSLKLQESSSSLTLTSIAILTNAPISVPLDSISIHILHVLFTRHHSSINIHRRELPTCLCLSRQATKS